MCSLAALGAARRRHGGVARRPARCARTADRSGGVVRGLRRGRVVRPCAAGLAVPGAGAQDFDAVVRMGAEGFATKRGRRSALLHRDEVNGRVRARRGARSLAITSGGAIPEVADYRVVLDPDDTFIGTLNEDFAIESHAGDVIQLGNASWQVMQIGPGVVRVADARGAPPTLPFWLGEAPARSDELSRAVSDLRKDLEQHLVARDRARLIPVATSVAAPPMAGVPCAVAGQTGLKPALSTTDVNWGTRDSTHYGLEVGPLAPADWLVHETGISGAAADQAVAYLEEGRSALGVLPTQETLVLERFFDESGGMQLVLHAPFGSRVNKAWGLALRKRFC
ncbi:MAG: hypothetical protein H0T71_16890, partial [Acidobacteria bacterium]|nr:hypothetical protein [Acidobacteriota bacterium]